MTGLKKNLSCLSIDERREMIVSTNTQASGLSILRMCELIDLNRSNYYYKPVPVSPEELKLLHLIDEIYTAHPYYGGRRMIKELADYGYHVGRDKIRSCYQTLGLEAIYPKANLSKRNHEHKVYPYLLRGVAVNKVNQVWSADITYIRLQHGYVYLVAIIDWYSRFILNWQLSTSLSHDFCVDTLQSALNMYEHPNIFNTDQGVQFTCNAWVNELISREIKVSMDGRGRALDNVFIERFWRSLKQEKIYLMDLHSVRDAKAAIHEYMTFYNTRRKHQALDYVVPQSVYYGK